MVKVSYYLLFLLFSIAFMEGLLAIFGIAEAITHLSINSMVIVLFLVSFYFMLRERVIKFVGFWLFILLLIVTTTSFLINDVSLLHLVFFVKIYLLPFFFFMALLNIPFTDEQREKILRFIMVLFLIQIPAAVVKTFLAGFQEDFVGTMSIEGGSLATVVPLIAIAYIFSYYLYHSNKKALLLMSLFVFVAISCSKLGIVLYLLLLLVLLYYIHEKNNFFALKTIKSGIIFIIVSYLILYIFVIMTPRANPDGVVGGRFDIVYALKFAETYTSRKNKEEMLMGVARKDAPMAVFNIISNKGIFHVLLGLGPGDIVMSSYLVEYYDPLYEKYHLGYGARTGFIWTTMQIGILGTLLYLLFQFALARRIYNEYKTGTDVQHKILLLATVGLSIIFFLDYFTYSTSLTIQPAMVLTYYYIFYSALMYKNINIPPTKKDVQQIINT
jgi:hypothetical protein